MQTTCRKREEKTTALWRLNLFVIVDFFWNDMASSSKSLNSSFNFYNPMHCILNRILANSELFQNRIVLLIRWFSKLSFCKELGWLGRGLRAPADIAKQNAVRILGSYFDFNNLSKHTRQGRRQQTIVQFEDIIWLNLPDCPKFLSLELGHHGDLKMESIWERLKKKKV